MLKTTFFVLLSILSFQYVINAQTVVGKYAGEFMAIGVGGRASGMGGAFTAAVSDVTGGYWNPAGLARIEYPEIALMHEEHFGNLVNYSYASVAVPYGPDMTFGLSVIRLGVDDIPDTRNALVDRDGNVIRDFTSSTDRINPDLVSYFSNQDWAIYLSFAKKHSDNFSYGANVKIIRRDIAEFGATGIGFDVGAQYSPYDKLYLGANIQDITTTLIAWNTGRNELVSPTMKLGAAYALDFLAGTFTPAVDVDVRFENRKFASQFNVGAVSFDPHAGLEYSYNNLFAIRAGYSDVKQITIGAGIHLPKLTIDYSFARFNSSKEERLDDSHRISLILTLETQKYKRK